MEGQEIFYMCCLPNSQLAVPGSNPIGSLHAL
jgi:hypothetical protein